MFGRGDRGVELHRLACSGEVTGEKVRVQFGNTRVRVPV